MSIIEASDASIVDRDYPDLATPSGSKALLDQICTELLESSATRPPLAVVMSLTSGGSARAWKSCESLATMVALFTASQYEPEDRTAPKKFYRPRIDDPAALRSIVRGLASSVRYAVAQLSPDATDTMLLVDSVRRRCDGDDFPGKHTPSVRSHFIPGDPTPGYALTMSVRNLCQATRHDLSVWWIHDYIRGCASYLDRCDGHRSARADEFRRHVDLPVDRIREILIARVRPKDGKPNEVGV